MSSNAISAQGNSMPLPSSEQSSPIMELPDDLIRRIIGSVSNPIALVSLASSCRKMRTLVPAERNDFPRVLALAKDEGVRKEREQMRNISPFVH